MKDCELLKLAAKAVGKNITANPDQDGKYHLVDEGETVWGPGNWNPLTNDGDALRLAVRLNLGVISKGPPQEPSATVVMFDTDCPRRHAVAHGDDPEAATRRAIVIAAASIALWKATP